MSISLADAAGKPRSSPARLALLSMLAALTTMALKLLAWYLTGSVAMLSDALESLVNLGASGVAFLVLRWAAQPPDDEHAHGHGKAEYLSSGFEGALIFVAAGTIIWQALPRLFDPQPIEQAGLGATAAMLATLINLLVARALFAGSRRHRSPALEADAHHLMSDVWTSVGIVVAVLLVRLTGWLILDPLVAIAVALYVLLAGWRVLLGAAGGLMDQAWEPQDRAQLEAVLAGFRQADGDERIDFHAIRTRIGGARRFVTLHVLVPGAWSVQRAHDFVEAVEQAVAERMGPVAIVSHLEPVEDPLAYDEDLLEKTAEAPPAASTEPRSP